MPVLRFKPGRVEEVLSLTLDEAIKVMEKLKMEVELEDGYIAVEIEVDRPDMYLLEGIRRQVKGLLGEERGLPSYSIIESGFVVNVENVVSRPCISAAVVWDVDVDEDFLEELIQFQEKLHLSLGEKRRRFAIGFHDLDKIPSKNLRYTLADIDSTSFIPLHGSKPLTLREVLSSSEQGKLYGSISLYGNMHPVIFSDGEVISMPPVINSELTRVEPGTKHLFVDVTGTDCKAVREATAVIAYTLAERSTSRRIGLVRIVDGNSVHLDPPTENRTIKVSLEHIRSWLGIELNAKQAVELLKTMRFEAHHRSGYVEVVVPPYRIDVIGADDIAEEIALALDLFSQKTPPPRLMLRGAFLPSRYWERTVRKLLAGYGFVEVKTYSLTSCRMLRELGYPDNEIVRIANPSVVDADCYRPSLLPHLLLIASRNTHVVPLKVFEVGEALTVCVSDSIECNAKDRGVALRKLVGILIMDEKVGYEDIQSIVYGVLKLTGDTPKEISRFNSRLFIKGRSAVINTANNLKVVLGEINPEILEKYSITYPVAYAEMDYTNLASSLAQLKT